MEEYGYRNGRLAGEGGAREIIGGVDGGKNPSASFRRVVAGSTGNGGEGV